MRPVFISEHARPPGGRTLPQGTETKQYRTKQKELILSCIQAHRKPFFTSKDVIRSLEEQGAKVGTATVYRNLERLEEEGVIARTTIEA